MAESIATLLTEGAAALEAHRFADAERRYQQALRQQP